MLRADWHARHALARLGELHFAPGIHFAHDPHGLGIVFAGHAKGLRNCVGGDVVMGRTDAAGGEDIIILAAQCVERRYDCILVVGHDTHFLQVDASQQQYIGEMADILVLRPAGEQFVADGQHGGCDNGFVRHGDIQENAQSARSQNTRNR